MVEHRQVLQVLEAKATATLQAANAEVAAKVHDMEVQGMLALQTANEISAAKICEIEEEYQRASAIANNQLLILQNEHTELQEHFSRHHQMLRELEEEKYILLESLHEL